MKNINTPIMATIGGIVLIVVGLIVLPIIVDQAQEVLDNEYADDFSGVEALTELVPLLATVVVIAIAGAIVFVVVRAVRGSNN